MWRSITSHSYGYYLQCDYLYHLTEMLNIKNKYNKMTTKTILKGSSNATYLIIFWQIFVYQHQCKQRVNVRNETIIQKLLEISINVAWLLKIELTEIILSKNIYTSSRQITEIRIEEFRMINVHNFHGLHYVKRHHK